MSLTKVGTSAATRGSLKSEGQTFTVTFTPDTTFATGDYLFVAVGLGGVTATSSLSMLKTDFSVSAGWHEFTEPGYEAWYEGYSSHVNFFPVYHFVTAAEASATPIVLTVTFDDLDTLNGSGLYIVPAGIAVRGGNTLQVGYAPEDNGDVDLAADNGGSTSPSTNTFGVATGYTGGADVGSLLFYIASHGGKMALTADSVAWTGPTELSDTFAQDWVETGANDLDTLYSSAYRLLDAADDTMPADSVVETFTGTSHSFRAARMVSVLDGTPVVYESPPPNFEPVSRRIHVRELPHQVSSPMFDDL